MMRLSILLFIILLFSCSYEKLQTIVLAQAVQTATSSSSSSSSATTSSSQDCIDPFKNKKDNFKAPPELKKDQILLIDKTYAALGVETVESKKEGILRGQPLLDKAKLSGYDIDKHLVYRYFTSSEWAQNFHGRKVEDAISDTAKWRAEFGISKIDPKKFKTLLKTGLAYTSGNDKNGRVIMYFKVGKNKKKEDSDTYLNLLMYTVERADRLAVENKSGQFVAVIDLEGFSLSTCPPISMIKTALGLLKKNYPYRLAGIFVINAGSAFTIMWNIVRPLMPKRALLKTFVLSKSEASSVLNEKLGLENLEDSYGGKCKEFDMIGDIDNYISKGYWQKLRLW